jgi:hypothetical protein
MESHDEVGSIHLSGAAEGCVEHTKLSKLNLQYLEVSESKLNMGKAGY